MVIVEEEERGELDQCRELVVEESSSVKTVMIREKRRDSKRMTAGETRRKVCSV